MQELLQQLQARVDLLKTRIEYNANLRYAIEQEEYNHQREVEHHESSGEDRVMSDEIRWINWLIEQLGTG